MPTGSEDHKDILRRVENGAPISLRELSDVHREGLIRLVGNCDDAMTSRVELTDAGRSLLVIG